MSERTRLLWHSNAPWAPTGYGAQTGLFIDHIAGHYDLAVSAFYGLEGSPISWGSIPVFPGMGQDFGNAYLADHARKWFGGDPRGGLVVTLMDVWVLDPALAAGLNMACWVPVDHQPAPPRVTSFFGRSGAIPIAMSRFGQEQLQAAGLDALYVPHAVDVDRYKPHDQRQVRQALGIPEDAFVIGMVAANKGRPSRKGFQQALEAFRIFSDKREDALFYLHTSADPGLAAGEDIVGLTEALGINPDRVKLTDQYSLMFDPVSPEAMARAYSMMDVLVNPAMGEGFGVPVLEAQACGVPVIVTDFSAMREVCGSGWKVEHRPYWTGQKSWQAVADVPDIVGALEECYTLPTQRRKKMSDGARQHALSYALPKVLSEHMLPALREVESRLADRAPVRLAAAA